MGGFRVPAIIKWPGKVPEGRVTNGIFSGMNWIPALVAAAVGPDDLPDALLEGYESYNVHLDGYNQLSYLLAGDESQRDEIVNYEGISLQAIRYLEWKANFVVQHYGWAGPKDELNAPLLFNLRHVLYENAAEQTGIYAN